VGSANARLAAASHAAWAAIGHGELSVLTLTRAMDDKIKNSNRYDFPAAEASVTSDESRTLLPSLTIRVFIVATGIHSSCPRLARLAQWGMFATHR
jgi:hypothetical protein